MRILFMGTPDFAVPSLQRLLDDGHEIVGVCCQPDKPQGRHFTLTPPPVKVLAVENNIPVFQPKTLRDEEIQKELAALAPEIIVVAAYGKILPREVLAIPPRGCINVHGSLLPKYRGAAPIQWAVIDDEVTSGVTIMQMEEGLDTGAMLLQRSLVIGEDETAGELFDRIAALGADALHDTLEALDTLTPVPQDEEKATWAPMLKKTDGEIDWSQDAKAIYARIRGVTPWPGAYTTVNGRRLKIHKARPVNRCGETGRTVSADGIVVACGHGALELIEVQPEGSRRMSAADYARGARIGKDTVFGG
jgi:methionyl-tRNA formyltransferase